MLLVSSMINVVVWGHEDICVDFQENNRNLSGRSAFCYFAHVRNHSLECKSVLIGMISPELCDSEACKVEDWLLNIGLTKLVELTLNLAALVIAALEYGRFVYGSELQLLRNDGNSNFYRTLGFIKLGLTIMGAVVCIAIVYLGTQFAPVVNELREMGCLGILTTADDLAFDMVVCTSIEMLPLLLLVIQDVVERCYQAKFGHRYTRVPSRIEPARSFIDRTLIHHFIQLYVYLGITSWGLTVSGLSWYHWGDSMQAARYLVESATTQGVGDWCFYCPGDKPTNQQLWTHMAVKYIGWFLVTLTAMTLLSMLVVGVRRFRC